jgi:hypothetical protein
MKIKIEMNKWALHEIGSTDTSGFKCALKLMNYYENTLFKLYFAASRFCFVICERHSHKLGPLRSPDRNVMVGINIPYLCTHS